MSSEPHNNARGRSTSRSRTSRPTTPLRPSSRSSFRESARASTGPDADAFPLATFEPAFAELSDAMADLEANMMHFQLMHESLSRFSESFASFLYGLNMNAFCVDFPEGPVAESFRRDGQHVDLQGKEHHLTIKNTQEPGRGDDDGETTFMLVDYRHVFHRQPSTILQTCCKA
ncbi:DASH complex subunit dam1 [Verticillium nonalfalfae]|uniref:DASH complex subunit DAM1 n=1 Tax=Verticillium nonalfalfae TaxID=1051616 RepID=A0A3M9Y1Q5_9PEZI|nr:DASH complex subunit dam1 [Verticillium nonalfalfae]RNJ53816.1 DASH complex subunit dam1 [Verticillium nonalfalfae]